MLTYPRGTCWMNKGWDPVTGCTKKSQGCVNCFAHRLAPRQLKKNLEARKANNLRRIEKGLSPLTTPLKYRNIFKITTHEKELSSSKLRSRIPTNFFVCGWSDLFHEGVPVEFIKKVFNVMNSYPQHTFQLLTKRTERMAELSPQFIWSPNIFAGTTIENEDLWYRIKYLRSVPAKHRFISCEPLLSNIPSMTVKSLQGIDWVIIGEESGPGFRLMKKEWAHDIVKTCATAKIPVWLKYGTEISKMIKQRPKGWIPLTKGK